MSKKKKLARGMSEREIAQKDITGGLLFIFFGILLFFIQLFIIQFDYILYVFIGFPYFTYIFYAVYLLLILVGFLKITRGAISLRKFKKAEQEPEKEKKKEKKALSFLKEKKDGEKQTLSERIKSWFKKTREKVIEKRQGVSEEELQKIVENFLTNP